MLRFGNERAGMPDQGVPPNPTGKTGGSGDQPAAGAPAPAEAKKAASSFGTLASGESAQEGRVPYERFKAVHDELKGAKEELARLKAQPTDQDPFFRTQSQPEGPNYDAQIAEYEKMARKSRDAGDEDSFMQAMRGIARLEGLRSTHETLGGFFKEQQERELQSRFESERSKALEKMFRDYPETSDPGSEFRKQTEELWSSDPYLRQLPDGEYKAAEIAWARRARQKMKPQALESSGAPSRATPEGEEQKKSRQAALEAQQRGDKFAVAEFFDQNLPRIIRPPKHT